MILKESVKGSWDSLPSEIQYRILHRVDFRDLFRFKVLSKSCKEYIESDDFSKWRGASSTSEGLFTAISYCIMDKAWRCTGFDLYSKTWRTLPPFLPIPLPDSWFIKFDFQYLVCAHGSLMCANVARRPKKGELVVFNPLNGKRRVLPPLLYPRRPVLIHMLVNSCTKSYEVIVAGSDSSDEEHLSKKVEVFDSKTSKWIETGDLPVGPTFGLSEYQAGVCVNGVLYFIAFLQGNRGRGVIAFDVTKRKWLDEKACPIPFSTNSNGLQLIGSNGRVYLCSEQEEQGLHLYHCIDVLENSGNLKADLAKTQYWKKVVRVKKIRSPHTCVPFGEGKVCVFTSLNQDGLVYDLQDGRQVEVLKPPPSYQKGHNFFSLNPASFVLQPSFDGDPIPPSFGTSLIN